LYTLYCIDTHNGVAAPQRHFTVRQTHGHIQERRL